jgi:hypothetical protein
MKDPYDDDGIVTLGELVPQDGADDEHDFDIYSDRCRRCGRTLEELLEDNDSNRCIPF